MNADGSDVRRLTDAPGYDGGPFFSPDGRRICWRHFAPSGATAEIMTMNVDGSDQRQLTHLDAMSWAPFYHPSGQYLIFTTNRHGMANFELYLVDVAGRRPPVRVTYCKGFDGLPVFSPDGRHLAWTTNRHGGDQSQIFLADWDDQRARQLLGLPASPLSPGGRGGGGEGASQRNPAATAGRPPSQPEPPKTDAALALESAAVRLKQDVAYLCRPELEGRMTGTPGESPGHGLRGRRVGPLRLAAGRRRRHVLPGVPLHSRRGAGRGQPPELGPAQAYKLDADWRPAAFSQTGPAAAAPVVFAGYGLAAPAGDGQPAYDSYAHLDVAGRWVLVFRYLPEDVSPQRRQQLAPYSNLRHKAMLARDKHARGLIVVNGPNAPRQDPAAAAALRWVALRQQPARAQRDRRRGRRLVGRRRQSLDADSGAVGPRRRPARLPAAGRGTDRGHRRPPRRPRGPQRAGPPAGRPVPARRWS